MQQAVDDNRGKMSTLLDTLKGLGVADKDIQTNNYSVYTQQAPVAPGASDTGALTYHVTNQVEVTVRDVNNWATSWTRQWLRVPTTSTA